MSDATNKTATVGCIVVETTTETAQRVVLFESAGYVLVDFAGICVNSDEIEEGFQLYVLTNHTGIYCCIIELAYNFDFSEFAIYDKGEINSDATNENIITTMKPIVMEVIARDGIRSKDEVADFRKYLDDELRLNQRSVS